ncbi:GNAT family N-acetyltransferase [Devosia faecipullorum]|uniref:GNAT family N-acetyltransferase n=1 Tax=Devosia faecipullorum TaxID=2755039 RepID=UPI00187B50FC|nr:GNAT family N-acetyltransferase [Devosia faecipullorum]
MDANSHSFGDMIGGIAQAMPHDASALRDRIRVRVTNRIEEVEADWRLLTDSAIESPGQSYDFIRLWVANRNIPESAQFYALGEVDGQVVAILPLHRKSVWGIKVFTWFPGSNAGCYAPVVDAARVAALGPDGRAALWSAMFGQLSGAGLVYMRSIPRDIDAYPGLFDELGTALDTETLYRAQFSSWQQCDAEQRSRSRRKHDRQQGERLAAMGDVSFAEVSDATAGRDIIDIMFQQRSERFKAQGIRDCFVEDGLIGFYQAAMEPSSGLDVRLHVLRLDGAVVAVRYNIVHDDRMFCLISSMSECAQIQAGSPGKQCLLRVMQSVFEAGFAVFDMGAGYTDEKRHWCNVQTGLRHHYVSLTAMGEVVVEAHQAWQRLRLWGKANPAVRDGLRGLRHFREKLRNGRPSDEL